MTQQTASAMTQGSRFQNSCGSATPQAEQFSPQQYYDYAQQLQSAGDEAQAGRYYEYARQLYDAALHTEQQQVGASTRGDGQITAAPQSNTADGQQASMPASWEVYYNYARQLHAAGHAQEAEAHYQYAQQLFSETAKQIEYQSAAAAMTYSVPPQHETSAVVSDMPRHSYPPQSTTMTGSYASASGWRSDDVEEDEPVQRRPKRPLKQRVKFWVRVIPACLLIVGMGGLVALFSRYTTQLNQTDAEKSLDHSLTSMVINAAIQPMIDALKPAFDKTIRLSDAAQPLLYELNLRATPPPGTDLNATDIAAADTATAPPMQNAPVPSPAPQAAPTAAAETGQPETATAADQPAAPASPTPGNEPATAIAQAKDADTRQNASTAATPENPPTADNQPTAAPKASETPTPAAFDDRGETIKKTSAPKKTHRRQHSVAHRNRQSKKSTHGATRNEKQSRPDLAKNKKGSAKNRNGAKLSDDPLAEFLL